jgi:hypothetical protein
MSLGGEKCIKDLVRLLRGQPHASIANRDLQLPVFRRLRFDRQFPAPIHILHRVYAVDDEAHQHLLEQHTSDMLTFVSDA